MSHELEETVAREGGVVWRLRTAKSLRGAGTQSRLTRWSDDGSGFLSIALLDVCGTVMAENGKRATLANVAATHAQGKAASLAWLASRATFAPGAETAQVKP